MRGDRRRTGFTLLELLLVVGIITILAGLLTAAVNQARQKAQAIQCASQLRQLSLAVIMHVHDNHQYPLAQDWGALPMGPLADPGLSHYLGRSQAVLECPAKARSATPQASDLGYGYNGLGTGDPSGVMLGLGYANRRVGQSQVAVPSEMILAGDAGTAWDSEWLLSPKASLKYSDGDWGGYPPGEEAWLPSGRHGGGAEMVFCDGHVECGCRRAWMAARDGNRARWNRDDAPHSETWTGRCAEHTCAPMVSPPNGAAEVHGLGVVTGPVTAVRATWALRRGLPRSGQGRLLFARRRTGRTGKGARE